MNFRRSPVFEYLMSTVGCTDYSKSGNYIPSLKKKRVGLELNAEALRLAMIKDCMFNYNKASISFIEACRDISRNSYSWATVKLYYSIFYAAKSSLLAHSIYTMRLPQPYRLIIKKGESISHLSMSDHRNDHESALKSFATELAGEYVLSNLVEDMNALEWIKAKRERVNYLRADFVEPDPPEYISEAERYIGSKGWLSFLQLSAEDAYVFDKDFAILLIPARIIIDTADNIERLGMRGDIRSNQIEYLEGISRDLGIQNLVRNKIISPVVKNRI